MSWECRASRVGWLGQGQCVSVPAPPQGEAQPRAPGTKCGDEESRARGMEQPRTSCGSSPATAAAAAWGKRQELQLPGEREQLSTTASSLHTMARAVLAELVPVKRLFLKKASGCVFPVQAGDTGGFCSRMRVLLVQDSSVFMRQQR